jgi:hypothetical protein
LYSRGWYVVAAPPGESFVTNDLGWTLVPYLLTVPMGPDRALVIDRTAQTSTYRHGADHVVLKQLDWAASEVRFQRQLLMAQAPISVFASSKSDCEEAMAIWAKGTAVGSADDDTLAALGRFPSWLYASVLRHDAPTDVWLAINRTRLATHRFRCSCVETMKAQDVPVEQIELAMKRLHEDMRRASTTLAPWQRESQRGSLV